MLPGRGHNNGGPMIGRSRSALLCPAALFLLCSFAFLISGNLIAADPPSLLIHEAGAALEEMPPPDDCSTTFYMHGIGDQSDVPRGFLKTSAPTDLTLSNFDPGRDAFPGLVIEKGGIGVGESDANQHQLWKYPFPIDALNGPVLFHFWASMKDHHISKGGSITVYLADCEWFGGDCNTITSVTLSRSDWDVNDTGTWIQETIDFGNVQYTVPPWRMLGVKIIVRPSSQDHMWFAYDAVQYPSRLIINAPAIPQITCPQDMTVSIDAGGCGALVEYAAPQGTVSCGNVSTSQIAGLPSGSTFPLGVTTNTFEATGPSPTTAQCSFTITVIDDRPPEFIQCPTDTTLITIASDCGVVMEWPPPIATDGCSEVQIEQTSGAASGSVFAPGTHQIGYTATDTSGNSGYCSFVIEVIDQQAPQFSFCPADITVPLSQGMCAAPVEWPMPTVIDNCSATVQQVSGPSSGSGFGVGTTVIEYIATDPAGNSATCSFTITVIDGIAPLMDACPADIIAYAPPGSCGTPVYWVAPSVSDPCHPVNVQQTFGMPPGSTFGSGNSIITYTATDPSGNSNSCSFTITVIDEEPPVPQACPSDIIMPLAPGSCDVIVHWDPPVFTDPCADHEVVQIEGPPGGSAFSADTTTITYMATDNAGNAAYCSFLVIITDTVTPVFTDPPTDIHVDVADACAIEVAWDEPIFTDCSPVDLQQTEGPASGSSFPIGSTTITYIATDVAGNSSTISFQVIVTDPGDPTFISCPGDIQVNANNSACEAVATWPVPEAIDLCSAVQITQIAGPASGSSFPLGSTAIIYVATDAAGNSDTCSFNVIVVDADPPVFASCPSNISIDLADQECDTIINWITPTAGDGCSNVTIEQTEGPPGGSSFSAGTTTIAYEATDDAGNSATCSFTVTVIDQQAPVFTYCPTDIAIGNDQGVCGAVVTWTVPEADDCSIVQIEQTSGPGNGSTFPIGETTIGYTATDASGNIATCTFNVTVIDNEAPIALCQPITLEMIGTDPVIISPQMIDAGSTDNCAIVNMSVTPESFSSAGIHDITLTITDAAGNSSSCTTTVEVIEPEGPVAICQDLVLYLDENGNAQLDPSDIDNGSHSTTGSISLSVDRSDFDCSDIGDQQVILTMIDQWGFTASCVSIVTVLDTIAPLAVCQNLQLTITEAGTITIDPGELNGGSTDNCGTGSLWMNADVTEFDQPGEYIVQFTVIDASGNSGSCNSIVIITLDPITGELLIPEGFSPNGDGIADTWTIQGIEKYPQNELIIFNRWGNELLRAAPYNNDWAGTANGELPSGVYFYQFIPGEGEAAITGFIQLSR